jgi:hypothetical protein
MPVLTANWQPRPLAPVRQRIGAALGDDSTYYPTVYQNTNGTQYYYDANGDVVTITGTQTGSGVVDASGNISATGAAPGLTWAGISAAISQNSTMIIALLAIATFMGLNPSGKRR